MKTQPGISTLASGNTETQILCPKCNNHLATLNPGLRLLSKRMKAEKTGSIEVRCSSCGYMADLPTGDE